MKETVKTSRAAGQLEKMFRALNRDSFGGELEEPIITIQSTPGAFGHVTVCKTWKRKDDWRHELNIAADWLERPIEELTATMIHEMVHLYNIKHNIQDCSRGGSYHNRKFKEEAEKHMISIEKHEKYGWTITKPTEALVEYIISQGWEEIQISRFPLAGLRGPAGDKTKGGETQTPEGEEKPKKTSWKHVCPKCKAIARTTKEFPLICGICKEEMVIED